MTIDHNPSITGAMGLTTAGTTDNPVTLPGIYVYCESTQLAVVLPDGTTRKMFQMPDETTTENLRMSVSFNGRKGILFLHAHSFLKADIIISAPLIASSVKPFIYVKTNGAQLGWLSTRRTLIYN